MPFQAYELFVLQNAATANGNGSPADTSGFTGAIQAEVVESAGGTATLALQGSMDGTNYVAVGYQQIDNTAVLTRAVANISITANSRHVYQILDPYPQMRAVLSAIAGGATVTVKFYMVPA